MRFWRTLNISAAHRLNSNIWLSWGRNVVFFGSAPCLSLFREIHWLTACDCMKILMRSLDSDSGSVSNLFTNLGQSSVLIGALCMGLVRCPWVPWFFSVSLGTYSTWLCFLTRSPVREGSPRGARGMGLVPGVALGRGACRHSGFPAARVLCRPSAVGALLALWRQ